jgi:hypothetical protein
VAHTCNPGYSGGGDQEDHGSKPASANKFMRFYLERKTSQKRAGGVAQGIGLNSNPSTTKK